MSKRSTDAIRKILDAVDRREAELVATDVRLREKIRAVTDEVERMRQDRVRVFEQCARIAEKAYRGGDTLRRMSELDGCDGFCEAMKQIAWEIREAGKADREALAGEEG